MMNDKAKDHELEVSCALYACAVKAGASDPLAVVRSVDFARVVVDHDGNVYNSPVLVEEVKAANPAMFAASVKGEQQKDAFSMTQDEYADAFARRFPFLSR